eukprot:CAMPEP_0170777254 /NCGR_PEP_ID=MMETSP0733-20121128/11671_1 /TAXON_ID=186038 /ORGANISM="Fragilariopsis kerguelensis, Strain L26-C5" /LENGTH=101 /DNA_ID=CAMNT_0011120421 /DNA_START=125 /DNA_END=430 /DNA_ORIENTATION=-
MDQTQGFQRTTSTSSTSGVVSRGRQSNTVSGSSRTGKTNNNIINNQSNDYELPTTQQETSLSPTTTTITNEGLSSSSTFDADSYRQQMIDLVYQRNLQRCV